MDIKNYLNAIRGLQLHDIAKPLWLGGNKHSPLGYVLLKLMGEEEEVCQWALLHHHKNIEKSLKQVNQETGSRAFNYLLGLIGLYEEHKAKKFDELKKKIEEIKIKTEINSFPDYMLLGNVCDIVSSKSFGIEATKSFQNWSFQNPFSRIVKNKFDSFSKDSFSKTEINKDLIEEFIETPVSELSQKLEDNLSNFPERTWPPENDTPLDLHCKASAIVGQVVFGNLIISNRSDNEVEIQLNNISKSQLSEFDFSKPIELIRYLVDYSVDIHNEIWVEFKNKLSSGFSWTNFQEIECEFESMNSDLKKNKSSFLDIFPKEIINEYTNTKIYKKVEKKPSDLSGLFNGYFVSIKFFGLNEIFDESVRLADLYGILKLRDFVKGSLKEKFARKLLSSFAKEEKIPKGSKYLPVNEFPFELIYFVPDINVEKIEKLINESYSEAIKANIYKLGNNAKDKTSLLKMLIDIRIKNEKLKHDTNEKDHQKLADSFINTYKNFIKDDTEAYSLPHSGDSTPTMNEIGADGADKCNLCRLLPVSDRMKNSEEVRADPFLNIITDNGTDRLCDICLGIRTLVYQTDDSDIGKNKCLKYFEEVFRNTIKNKDNTIIYNPPTIRTEKHPVNESIIHTGKPAGVEAEKENYYDMKFAFVTKHKDNTLSFFPTFHYVADSNSNMVYMDLNAPLKYITEPYYYERLDKDIFEIKKYYWDLLEKIENDDIKNKELKSPPAHLGRIFARIEQINTFYSDFLNKLKEEIRFIPFEDEFPSLKILFPLDRIDRVIEIFVESFCRDLLSIDKNSYENIPDNFGDVLDFMEKFIPPIFVGSMIVCKVKQPIYNTMEISRNLIEDTVKDNDGSTSFNGALINMADIRGNFSNKGIGNRISWPELFYTYFKSLKDKSAWIPKRLLVDCWSFENKRPEFQKAARAYALNRAVRVIPSTQLIKDFVNNEHKIREISSFVQRGGK